MLQRASDAANIWEAGTPPYHLSTAVHFKLGGRKFDGRYDLWWAAPDRYREGFMMPAEGGVIAETDLALGNKFYTRRNTPTLSIPLWETRRALRMLPKMILGEGGRGIWRRYWNKRMKQSCIDKEYGVEFLFESCFDATSRKLETVRLEPKPQANLMPAAESMLNIEGSEANDFADFPIGKRFPHKLNYREYDMSIQITVLSLEPDSRFDNDTFVPTPRSKVSEWCPAPVLGPEPQHRNDFPLAQSDAPGKFIAYYIHVAPDGHVLEVVPVRSGGSSLDGRMEKWIRGTKYGTLSCSGHAIEWEGIEEAPEEITP